jgi:ribosomal protein S4E
MRMNPDIIFVEKSVSKDLLKFFCENKICVINGLTKGEMSKIAHISCAKTIKNVLTVGRENGRFIGTLGSMKIVAKPPLNNSLIYL